MDPKATAEVSPAAAARLHELHGGDPARAILRVFVSGRTCCGVRYGMAFDEVPAADDVVIKASGVTLAVDPLSRPYCAGITIDYVTSDEGEGFTITSPMVGGGCTCHTRGSA